MEASCAQLRTLTKHALCLKRSSTPFFHILLYRNAEHLWYQVNRKLKYNFLMREASEFFFREILFEGHLNLPRASRMNSRVNRDVKTIFGKRYFRSVRI